jgi:hypothetical protein
MPTIIVKAAPRFATILCLHRGVRGRFASEKVIEVSVPLIWELFDAVSMFPCRHWISEQSQRTLAIPIGDADSAEGAMIQWRMLMRP